MSDTYVAIEQIATNSYKNVKSRLSDFSFYVSSRSTNIPRRQSQTSDAPPDENSAVSSLSGGSYDPESTQVLQSSFRLATGGQLSSSSNTDLDSLSICVKNAKEGSDVLLGFGKDVDWNEQYISQPLFIHYVPV